MLRRMIALLQIALTLLTSVVAQGMVFTYQGVLKIRGTPLNGNTDIVFALFDEPAGGNPVGAPLPIMAANGNPVVVDNGGFAVTLDCGPVPPVSDQRSLTVTLDRATLAPLRRCAGDRVAHLPLVRARSRGIRPCPSPATGAG